MPRYMRPLKALVTWLDVHDGAVTALATVVIALLTFFYVRYARKQWEVMGQQLGEMVRQYPELQKSAEAAKTQADLNRLIAEGTQSADVEAGLTAEIEPDGAYTIIMGLQNKGNSSARDIFGDFTFSVQTQGKSVSTPQPLHIEKGQLRALSGNPNSIQKTMKLSGITRDTVVRGIQTCLIQGSYQYNNGFDHKIIEPACWKIMRRALINTGTVDHWEADVIDCSQVDQMEALNARYAKQIDK
jgi:hypothetical protein